MSSWGDVGLILGIETSCDDTSVGLLEGGRCLGLATQSSVDEHAAWGGIVPELASRQHILAVGPVVEQALADGSRELSEVVAVAATHGPGLAGSLLVGFNYAQGLAVALGVPLLPVNHLAAHAHACWLDQPDGAGPGLPAVCLLVSGGHTELTLMHSLDKHQLLGRTRDDAVGEAFDKAARIMGLGFPGGPAIERTAQQCRQSGLPPFSLPRPALPGSWDFSFAGLKSAIGRARRGELGPRERKDLFADGEGADFAEGRPAAIAQMAAGFQDSVVEVLVSKTVAAAQAHEVKSVLLCGGVAANRQLRESLTRASPVPVHIPEFAYCTDNGAMVAMSGTIALAAGAANAGPTDIDPSLRLT